MKLSTEITVEAGLEKAWKLWTNPAAISCWNLPSADWYAPKAESDLREGGRFFFRMESRDKKEGFDFSGTYDKIIPNALIEYTLDDGRKVQNTFVAIGPVTKVTEIFEPDKSISNESQIRFCLGVLKAFKAYVETQP